MPGPAPKHPSARQRRNKSATARTLEAVHDVEAPELPKVRGISWHPMTVQWWASIWASPMAPEYDPADLGELYKLASLENCYWETLDPKLLAEIRLQRQCFGLTPLDRRRLQWEIKRGDDAERSTRKRRNEEAQARPKGDDARNALAG